MRAFGTDQLVADWLSGMGGGGRTALAVVLVMLGLCTFVLDAYEMIFVVIPIVMPPLLMRVPDATWVAVLTLLVLQTSFLVPPMGYAVPMVRHRLARTQFEAMPELDEAAPPRQEAPPAASTPPAGAAR